MGTAFTDMIEASPIIAAVKDDDGLEACLESDVDVVFILYGDICSIRDIVSRVRAAGKLAMVHIDLIVGLSGKDASLDYLKNIIGADGVITTKHNLIAHAREIGLYTVLRYFLLDSMALLSIEKQQRSGALPDVIEILPGIVAPRIIRTIVIKSRTPVICGGLIQNREDVMHALNSGATAISTTSRDVWRM